MAVRILADDLTGALDAGACFAGAGRPLPVRWRADAAMTADDLVLDVETRDLPEADALDRLHRHLPDLAAADIAFKKIDSLMRGNSAAEMAACARSPLFRSVVVAPAFPAQRRITRQGQQLAWRTDAGRWAPAGPNLIEALLGPAGGRAIHVSRGTLPSGGGAFVCDAETEDDLSRIAGCAAKLDRPVLWCGTAGLAHALAGPARPVAPPPAARILAVIGSRHPMTVAQVERIGQTWPDTIVEVAQDTPHHDAVERTQAALDADGLALLVPSDTEATTAAVDTHLAALLDTMCRTIAADACIATGGVTLRILLDAMGCDGVTVEGEIEPGIPFARIRGRRWDGTGLVSKAGAFGTPATVRDIIQAMRGEVHP